MQALILAGGKGTRLKPYTTVLPKPLMPVGNLPVLEIIIRQLRHAGVDKIILAAGYLSHLLQAFFQDGQRLGVSIEYSIEEAPLGTAGPMALVMDQLEDHFLVMNGDLLTTLSYRNIFDYHLRQQAAATIGLYQRSVSIDFGVIEADADGRLANYIEKPTYHFAVSMGVNIFTKAAVQPFLQPGQALDIPQLMLQLKNAGQRVCCYSEPCSWLDIGRVEDYQEATETFEERKAEFLPGGA